MKVIIKPFGEDLMVGDVLVKAGSAHTLNMSTKTKTLKLAKLDKPVEEDVPASEGDAGSEDTNSSDDDTFEL